MQPKSNIEPKALTFTQLLQGRLFRIPRYQRAYSWQGKHRRDMFDDILNLKEKTDNSHFMATIVGLHTDTIQILADNYDRIDIVDGQQRLTTLVILLKIIEKQLTGSLTDDNREKRTTEARLEQELRELLVKPDEASLILLQTNHDQNEYFVDFIREGTIAKESEANTLADRELLRAFQECKDYVHDEWGDPVELLHILKNRLLFIFYQTHDEETVHTIFESLNNRGLDVSPLEILKNKLMEVVCKKSKNQGNREEHIEELHRIWGDFYKTVGMREGVPVDTDALGFGTTLITEKSPSKIIGVNNTVELLIGNRDDTVNLQMSKEEMNVGKTIKISKWLLKVAKAVDTFQTKMRQPLTDIRQARLLGTSIILREDFSDDEKSKLLHQWEKTTFHIFGLCDNDARTAVGDYVRLAWEIRNDHNLSCDDILERIPKIETNHNANHDYEIPDMDFYTELKQRERLRYLLYRYEENLAEVRGQRFSNEQWNFIWKATVTDSIEHILPQSKAVGDEVHRIGNLLLLPLGLNSGLRDKDPKDKAKVYLQTRLHMAEDVANLIKKYGEWDVDTIRMRTEEIRDWIMDEYGS